MNNGERHVWRLRVELPDPESVDRVAFFAWVKDWLIPACLNAPAQVTLEFVPPDDRRMGDDDGPMPERP